MTKPKPVSRPNPTEAAARAGAAAATSTGLAILTGGSPVAAGVGAVLSGVVGFAVGGALAWKGEQVDRWWREVAGADREAFEEELRARVEEPAVQETILRSIRTVLDAVEPASIAPLARLSRWYLEEGRAPDPFFRGAARLLAEATATELADLGRIVAFAAGNLAEPRGTVVLFERPNGETPTIRLQAHPDRSRADELLVELPWPSGNAERVFELLEFAGLGRMKNTWEAVDAQCTRDTFAGLARILDGAAVRS